jgi:hypothetical protein
LIAVFRGEAVVLAPDKKSSSRERTPARHRIHLDRTKGRLRAIDISPIETCQRIGCRRGHKDSSIVCVVSNGSGADSGKGPGVVIDMGRNGRISAARIAKLI